MRHEMRAHFENRIVTGDVLFLAQLPPPHHGQSAMAAAVHEVLAGQPGWRVEHHWEGGARSNEDVGKRSPGKYLGFGRLLARLARMRASGRRFDIAYLGMAPWAHTAIRDALLAAMARRIAGRVLIHLHGEGLTPILDGKTRRDRLIRRLITGCELIAITAGTAETARGAGVFSAVLHLPNQAADPGEKRQLPARPLALACLGNLDPRKGVLDFTAAIEKARREGLPVTGHMVGGPTSALGVDEMRSKVAERGLAGDLVVTGRVSEEDKSAILAGAHVFLYLSRHDLAPLALIEALAHGMAPIVLDVGGIAEMMGAELRHNVLAPSLKGEELADAVTWRLEAYLADPARLERDRSAARRRYEACYSPDRFRAALGRFAAAGTGSTGAEG